MVKVASAVRAKPDCKVALDRKASKDVLAAKAVLVAKEGAVCKAHKVAVQWASKVPKAQRVVKVA